MALEIERFFIPKDIYDEMLRFARKIYPLEACGILAGSRWKTEIFYPMKNIDNSGEHFMMEPEEQFKVVKDIRKRKLEMIGIFHSHPETPARPSAEDIRLALTPGVVYLILSLMDEDNPDLKGFDIEDNEVASVEIEIEDKVPR